MCVILLFGLQIFIAALQTTLSKNLFVLENWPEKYFCKGNPQSSLHEHDLSTLTPTGTGEWKCFSSTSTSSLLDLWGSRVVVQQRHPHPPGSKAMSAMAWQRLCCTICGQPVCVLAWSGYRDDPALSCTPWCLPGCLTAAGSSGENVMEFHF